MRWPPPTRLRPSVGPLRARGAGVEFTLALERAPRCRRRRQLGPLRLLSTTTTKAKPVRQFPLRSLARFGRRARDNKRARPRFRPRSRAPATRDADKMEQGESAHRRIDCRRGVGRTRALVSDGRAAARFADRGKGPPRKDAGEKEGDIQRRSRRRPRPHPIPILGGRQSRAGMRSQMINMALGRAGGRPRRRCRIRSSLSFTYYLFPSGLLGRQSAFPCRFPDGGRATTRRRVRYRCTCLPSFWARIDPSPSISASPHLPLACRRTRVTWFGTAPPGSLISSSGAVHDV